jgi:hypothetical protein
VVRRTLFWVRLDIPETDIHRVHFSAIGKKNLDLVRVPARYDQMRIRIRVRVNLQSCQYSKYSERISEQRTRRICIMIMISNKQQRYFFGRGRACRKAGVSAQIKAHDGRGGVKSIKQSKVLQQQGTQLAKTCACRINHRQTGSCQSPRVNNALTSTPPRPHPQSCTSLYQYDT